jgi:pSer/pThr/pTyr-binding forkhead associated (FHA) protein
LDCLVRFSGAELDEFLSRHHCELEIDPPALQVRDLGSRNGTYLNGKEVDAEPKVLSEQVGCVANHGDLLTLGGMTLRVDILECPQAGKDPEGKSIWAEGETVTKDCPLPC